MRWDVGLLIAVTMFSNALPSSSARAQTRKKPGHVSGASSHASRTAMHSTAAHGSGRQASHGKVTGNGKKASSRLSSSKGRARTPELAASTESRRLSAAFTASSQLRPMAQQLSATRSAPAYSGVQNYAAAHPGEGAAAAELALGHAYMLDHRYGDAQIAFRQANQQGQSLDDYADYLGAEAALQGNRAGDAVALLTGFTDKYPGSVFTGNVPILLANAYLAAKDSGNALRILSPAIGTPAADHTDFRLTLAKAYQASGDVAHASATYRAIYLGDPLSNQAVEAKKQLDTMSVPLTPGERKQHADALFNAKHYDLAAQEYRALGRSGSGLSQGDIDALEIYVAVCDLRLKRLSRSDVDRLPLTSDDTAALKMYLQSELARNEGHADEHDALVQQLLSKFPQSRWTEEALYSGGNMYLIKRDASRAIDEYSELTQHFPRSTYSPSAHWRAAWLSYRQRRYSDAARLMDDQITTYVGGTEIPGALYWRGRLYEDVEHNFAQAANYYKALDASFVNSYYAMLGRQRLAVIGNRGTVEPAPALAAVRAVNNPHLIASPPENDPHLIKARLLANAALNEYIRPEIQLSPTAEQWGALAEAQIYQSFGENTRAIQAMKRSKIPFLSLPVAEVPTAYWTLVFPRPYWQDLTADARANGLDPYLVASLIRQESEFNPGAVSKANAYGLMQLLPSVGKSIAKKNGIKHFSTNDLLKPTVNLQLGTIDLRQSINRFDGQLEYALASYNAGDTPVRQWIMSNDYKDIPEWVESIPYTETRDYVQAILRNREIYRAVYGNN